MVCHADGGATREGPGSGPGYVVVKDTGSWMSEETDGTTMAMPTGSPDEDYNIFGVTEAAPKGRLTALKDELETFGDEPKEVIGKEGTGTAPVLTCPVRQEPHGNRKGDQI
ncbi:uncharacterized protein LOC117591739 [Drosophila guanche]|uniref:uncharacterized protein LOC117591739 n=1 Tax=Drosophila guanche TaxID=7266 RepID=UPI0014723BF8|nr:uncharacterized protein LOC117591739 [Drosophila guanche]